MIEIAEVEQLRDESLIERLSLSVRSDRRLAVRMLVEMGGVQARGLYRELGFSSMFDFATRKLGMSESEAGLRIRAAKVGRAFPEALEMLARCEVTLTTLSLLLPVLDHDSLHLLHAARGKSKQEVQSLIAAHAPKPDAPDLVRRLPPPRPPRASALAQRVRGLTPGALEACDVHACTNQRGGMLEGSALQDSPQSASTDDAVTDDAVTSPIPTPDVHACTNQDGPGTSGQANPQHAAAQLGGFAAAGADTRTAPAGLTFERPPPRAAAVVQLTAERHRISFTASARVLKEAQDLRRHRHPGGALESCSSGLSSCSSQRRRSAGCTFVQSRIATRPSGAGSGAGTLE